MQVQSRFQAAGIHLGISLCIAALAATLVFALWYPYPYRDLSGGRELFTMLVSIDVILGPLLTLAVFDIKKTRKLLVLDLVLIGLVQLSALGYGLRTVFEARPVYMVFEFDRFRVTHAADIDPVLLPQAPPALQQLPLTGPTMLTLRPLRNDETFTAIMAAFGGAQMAFRPDLWQPYNAQAKQRAWDASKPVAALLKKYPGQQAALAQIAQDTGFSESQLRYLPAQARNTVWSAILRPQTADIIGFLPVNGFEDSK